MLKVSGFPPMRHPLKCVNAEEGFLNKQLTILKQVEMFFFFLNYEWLEVFFFSPLQVTQPGAAT